MRSPTLLAVNHPSTRSQTARTHFCSERPFKLFKLVNSVEKTMATTPVLLPGKSHGWRSLVGCSPWGREESDTTERLHFHFPLSYIGEGNSNPLQCSCLENPREGGAWWAAVHGVAKSRTWLSDFTLTFHFKRIGRDHLFFQLITIFLSNVTWFPTSYNLKHD